MQPTLCSRCKKNVAVIFITRMDGGEPKNEGLCLKCARELHIKPVDDVINKMGLTDDELCEMGLKLGADVPFCLRGGTMLAQGIGEELSLLPDMPHCWVVLCKPPFAVPTKEVYQEIDSVDILEHPDNKGMMAALDQGDYEGVCAYLSNVMETVTAAKRRQIGEIKSFLAENGADGTLMSGSGPTVYGLFSDESRAKTAAKMLRRRFADTFLTETCN